MKKRFLSVTLAAAVFFAAFLGQDPLFAKRTDGQDEIPQVPEMEQITKSDSILIFAPHPDDETLGTGGVIQKALKAGTQVNVVYLTNGENNELSFIVYEKRIVFKQKGFIAMGKMRQEEAINAMKYLGLPENNLIFLGYPDFGTLSIFLRYWGETTPFRNMLTRVSHVPYENALTPNAPYKGDAVLWDIESVLKKYKPTKIFITSSVDTNRDHRAFYLFLSVALLELKGQIPAPKIYSYLIHCYGWPKSRNYHPEFYLNVPKLLEHSQLQWHMLTLSGEELEKKHQAISLYKSQCSDSAFYLMSFARKNELFCQYPEIDLIGAQSRGDFEIATTFKDKTVTYGRLEKSLVINAYLKSGNAGLRRLYVNMAGYKAGTEFARMPKIKIIVNSSGVKMLERGKFIDVSRLSVEQKNHSISIRVPLDILGDPDYVLSSVNTYSENYSTDMNAWRIIKLR